jgi:hypothetical protein
MLPSQFGTMDRIEIRIGGVRRLNLSSPVHSVREFTSALIPKILKTCRLERCFTAFSLFCAAFDRSETPTSPLAQPVPYAVA